MSLKSRVSCPVMPATVLHILMTVTPSIGKAAQLLNTTCRFQINLGTGTYASGASVRSASPRHRANHLWSGASVRRRQDPSCGGAGARSDPARREREGGQFLMSLGGQFR